MLFDQPCRVRARPAQRRLAEERTRRGLARWASSQLLRSNRHWFCVRQIGIVRLPVHPAAPLLIVVPHAVFVMDRLVFMTAMKDTTRLRPGPHCGALALHAEQVLVQVAAEWTPDRVVVIDSGLALLGGVALE